MKRKKATRDSLDKRILKAKTPQEKMRLVLSGRAHRQSRAGELAREWRAVISLRDGPKKVSAGAYWPMWHAARKAASDYMRDAMVHWQPGMLAALAREMTRLDRAKESQGDALRYNLLQAAKCGPVNLSATKRLAEERHEVGKYPPDLKTWRRVAHRLRVKLRKPGRPRK